MSPPVARSRRRADAYSRVWFAIALLGGVLVVGTVGYLILGLSLLDAMYQTATTVTTVGFKEVVEFNDAQRVFTIALVLGGVGTALYTFGVLLESLVEGGLTDEYGRRRMQRSIDQMRDHVIVCGWGRVGQTVAAFVAGSGREVVVIERDPDRIETLTCAYVEGEATDDAALRAAGIERAHALVAAVTTDADNLYITISGRALNANLVIVARARLKDAEEKLLRAGADRVVNPQQIGGARMAAFTVQPHVAEFVDVVMHDGSLEFRLEEVIIAERSGLVGTSLRDANIRDGTGALVLALRDRDGNFLTNPPADTVLAPGQVLIAIGTRPQLAALTAAAR